MIGRSQVRVVEERSTSQSVHPSEAVTGTSKGLILGEPLESELSKQVEYDMDEQGRRAFALG